MALPVRQGNRKGRNIVLSVNHRFSIDGALVTFLIVYLLHSKSCAGYLPNGVPVALQKESDHHIPAYSGGLLWSGLPFTEEEEILYFGIIQLYESG